MIKKILFSLAALSIYANAMNCLEAYFKTEPIDYHVPGDYVLDSLYKVPAEGMESEPWFKKYYYTPGNTLPDSLFMADSKDTVKTVFHFTQEADTLNGLITVTIKNNGELYGIVKYMKVVDDMHPYSYKGYDSDGEYKLDGYVNITEDSLYVYEDGEKHSMVMDANNPNVCYKGNPGDDNYMKITYEAKGDTIHLTTDSQYSLTDLFFIPLYPQESTIGIRKMRPVANIKKYQYFDLLGRPAVNKHSVQIRK